MDPKNQLRDLKAIPSEKSDSTHEDLDAVRFGILFSCALTKECRFFTKIHNFLNVKM